MEDYNLNEEYKSGSEGTEDGNMEIRSEDEKKNFNLNNEKLKKKEK